MPIMSQPLNVEISEKLKKYEDNDGNRTIKAQRMGKMFDDLDDSSERKVALKTRLGWEWRDLKGFFRDIKYSIFNHIKWHKTMKKIRPWEGFEGLIDVVQTHLEHYIECEEKYGHSEKSCKQGKISTAKEAVALLERMRDPMDYSTNRTDAVRAKYPDYLYLISEYKNGGTRYSGDFVAQGNGWVGKESGNDPREGYFELVDGKYELATSPEQTETDRLLAEIAEYSKELHNAYRQAETDSEEDFDRLGQLLKENFYTWWD